MFENFDGIGAMRSSPIMVVILFCSVVTMGPALERVYGVAQAELGGQPGQRPRHGVDRRPRRQS